MPIPSFDHNHILPPHLGNPANPADISPYVSNIEDFCKRFATSKERIEILKGFINLRIQLTNIGVIEGFQWVDGSFLENIEVIEGRPPNDIDVVTFHKPISVQLKIQISKNHQNLISPTLSKSLYHTDHYLMNYCESPEKTVQMIKYWLQLFSHNRNGQWKGMVELPLNTYQDDQNALQYLNSLVV